MKILIIGPVGSGKTTQAELLAGKLGVGVLRVGDLVRERAHGDDEIGQICNKALHSGHLVPDEIVSEMVIGEIEQKLAQGFVTDSYPRRRSQIDVYDPKLDQVFCLKLSDEEVTNRLLARKRDDDKPEIIAERIKVYHEETEPLLELYREQGILIEIDGHGSVDEIHEKIMESVGRSHEYGKSSNSN